MSIRYYLLLVAGFITTCLFIGTFFLDNFLLNQGLQKTHMEGEALTKELFEEKRQYLQEFIATDMAASLAKINALLEAIAKFQPLAQWFAPTLEYEQKGTWVNATGLIQHDDWIRFLQNTAEGKVLSLVIPSKGPFFSMQTQPIREGVSWVYVNGATDSKAPFLGIQVPIQSQQEPVDEVGSVLASGIIPEIYILYDWEKFKRLSFPAQWQESVMMQSSLAGGVEIDESKFLEYLTYAHAFSQKTDVVLPSFSEPADSSTKPLLQGFSAEVEKFLQEQEKYANELFLLCQASALQQAGFLQKWPDAMAFSAGPLDNQVFFLQQIMDFPRPVFDDEAFFSSVEKKEGQRRSSQSFIVKSPQGNQAFLVNTVAICPANESESKRSLLTLGVGLKELLLDIVSSFRHYGAIVQGGKVLVNLAPAGKAEIDPKSIEDVLSRLEGLDTGLVSVQGKDYWFSIVQPDPNLNMQFVFFDLKEEVFGLLYNFQNSFKSILNLVEFKRKMLEVLSLIVLWLLLLRISKKITEPVTALSASLKYVEKGQWDLIQLPKIRFSKKNEIRQLCDSFHDMVEGLKEKEKVTGILNKVVSAEIAKEILKGGVRLGGEDRIVTMLFVDIRGFTNLTQNMPPHEVIEFLNACMTKLSLIIEENKGVIDKFLGDGLMALYGAPIAYIDSPLHAILSALEIIRVLKQWNQERLLQNLPPIHVGIGIHTGSVCVGNMGAQNRLNYTVIGSAVNMASRLCSKADPEEILISKDTYLQEGIKDKIQVEDKGLMTIKGFDEKIQVFKVIGT